MSGYEFDGVPLPESMRGLLPRNAPDQYLPTEPHPCPYCGAVPFDGSVFWAPGEVLEHDRLHHPWLFEEPTDE
jgi:hypothetical protein